eukprot:comp16472_c0_seq1/m.26377 comp16472_c0_seq1/g.26377  ORF comp16472_c0_seq1/g.26377 comp16472_c0_seq1/m.26377 type:complete len:169 (-) comp16472_c0_seq1:23-529(-)
MHVGMSKALTKTAVSDMISTERKKPTKEKGGSSTPRTSAASSSVVSTQPDHGSLMRPEPLQTQKHIAHAITCYTTSADHSQHHGYLWTELQSRTLLHSLSLSPDPSNLLRLQELLRHLQTDPDTSGLPSAVDAVKAASDKKKDETGSHNNNNGIVTALPSGKRDLSIK